MKTPAVCMCAVIVLGISSGLVSAETWNSRLSRGHNILVQEGLQLQASCYGITETFNLANWKASHFTTVHFWDDYPSSHLPASPGLPWAVSSSTAPGLGSALAPYAGTLVSYQMGDEQDITDPDAQAELKWAMEHFHSDMPHVLTFTNQWGRQFSKTDVQTYMQQVQPDMLCFDTYPFGGDVTGGSPTGYYADMQEYRKLGMAGNDGTGTRPIPVGFWTQTVDKNHTVSESEIRLNNYSGWAFGYKFASAFLYQNPTATRILFSDQGTNNPTPQFYQVAETNRQSLNLGPALVRLVSTGLCMKMGRHTETNWFGQKYGVANDRPDDVPAWSSTAVPYLKNVTATNLGMTNDSQAGDVIVGVFKPLDASFTNAGHENDVYFMVVNGLSDAVGSAVDCRQLIHLDFDFGTSGINSLLRLSRETGRIEEIALDHISGSQYGLDLYLDGGTGDLFKFDNGGMFVPEPSSGIMVFIGMLFTWCFVKSRKQR